MEEIIIKFAGKIVTLLKIAASSIFSRMLFGAGLAFANFQYVLPEVKSFMQDKLSGLPPLAMQIMGAAGIDVFIVIVVSAVVVKTGMRMLLVSLNSIQGMTAQEPGT